MTGEAPDATAMAALVRSGQASPRELVEAAIERIERLDGPVNAVVHRRFEKALAEADGPLPDGPFRGVPIVLKDLRAGSAGDPDHQGNAFLRAIDHRESHDANVTARLRRAGFVVLGRTNTPEFGLVSTTEPTAFGPTRNPWDVTRSPGGSSGGSAVAVATGMVPLAQGTDGGGSLRMPSAHCGVFGFKSSRGRVSAGPDEGDAMAAHNIYGVITRTVRDSAAALDAIAGYQSGDPVVAPAPATGSFRAAALTDPGSLRIGVMLVDDVNGYPVDPRVNDVVRTMADRLAGLGHRVEHAYPEAMTDPTYLDHWLHLLSPSVTVLMDSLAARAGRPLRREEFEEVTWWWAEQGATVSAAEYVRHEAWRDDFRRRMASWWTGGFDLLLSPVVPNPPPPLGVFDGPDGIRKSIDILCFTPQFNTTGQPAMSVPAGLTEDGLPVGVQFAAGYGREETLFALAAQIEAVYPWPVLGGAA